MYGQVILSAVVEKKRRLSEGWFHRVSPFSCAAARISRSRSLLRHRGPGAVVIALDARARWRGRANFHATPNSRPVVVYA